MKNTTKKYMAAVLIAALLFTLTAPLVSRTGAEGESKAAPYSAPARLLTMSDFQNDDYTDPSSAEYSYAKDNFAALLDAAEGLVQPETYVFVGDYSNNYDLTSALSGKETIERMVYNKWYDAEGVFTTGNHEQSLGAAAVGANPTGAYEYGRYIVYVINAEDFPSVQNSSAALIAQTAQTLDEYLDSLIARGDERPVFVCCHVPLHFSSRTQVNGDNLYSKLIFDVLNAAGETLDIVYLWGHNHAVAEDRWYNDYIGGSCTYLSPACEGLTTSAGFDRTRLRIPDYPVSGSQSGYTDEILNFTYTSAGFVGYYGSGVDDTLTLSEYSITDDSISLARYSKDGLYTAWIQGNENVITRKNTPQLENLKAELSRLSATLLPSNGCSSESYYAYFTAYNKALELADSSDLTAVRDAVYALREAAADLEHAQISDSSGVVYTLDSDGLDDGDSYLTVLVQGGVSSAMCASKLAGGLAITTVTPQNRVIRGSMENCEWTFTQNADATVTLAHDLTKLSINGNDNLSLLETGGNTALTLTAADADSWYVSYTVNGTVYALDNYGDRISSFNLGQGAANRRVYFYKRLDLKAPSAFPTDGASYGVGSDAVSYHLDSDGLDAGESYILYFTHGTAANAGVMTTQAYSNGALTVQNVTVDGQTISADCSNAEFVVSLPDQNSISLTTSTGTLLSINGNGNINLVSQGGNTILQLQSGYLADSYAISYTVGSTVYALDNFGGRISAYTLGSGAANRCARFYKKLVTLAGYYIDTSALTPARLWYGLADLSQYTPESVAEVQTAFAAAEALATSSAYSSQAEAVYAQTDFNNAIAVLNSAIENLTPYQPDRSALSASIDAALAVDESLYGSYTLSLMWEAYANAITVYNNSSASQQDINSAADGLNNAILNLRSKQLEQYPEYPDPGYINIDKVVSDSSRFLDLGVSRVELAINGIPKIQDADIVLIIDISSSMNATVEGSSESKLSLTKAAAVDFVEDMYASIDDVRIAALCFSSHENYADEANSSVPSGGATLTGEANAVISGSEYGDIGALVDSSGKAGVVAAINALTTGSGTNYDYALSTAYDIVRDAVRQTEEQRHCYVVFMTDGLPNQLNGYGWGRLGSNQFTIDGDSASKDRFDSYWEAVWRAWMSGNIGATKNPDGSYAYDAANGGYSWDGVLPDGLSEADISAAAAELTGLTSNAANVDKFRTLLDHNYSLVFLQKHREYFTAGIGDSFTAEDAVISDAMIATAIEAGGQSLYSLRLKELGAEIFSIAFGFSYTQDAFTVEECQELLQRICTKEEYTVKAETATALTEAFEEVALNIKTAGENAMVTDTIGEDYRLQTETLTDGEGRVFAPSIELESYAVVEGERVGQPVSMELVSFNAQGTEAYSSLMGDVNIMDASGNINAVNFDYDAASRTFTWRVGIINEQELCFAYDLYLLGSMTEGENAAWRTRGVYATNESAIVRYRNYHSDECERVFPVPTLPWDQAQLAMEYYLVNAEGQPVNTRGEVIPFEARIIVGDETLRTLPLNAVYTAYAYDNAPTGYELFNTSAAFTVLAASDVTNSYCEIDDMSYIGGTQGNGVSTFVNHPSVYNTPGIVTGSGDCRDIKVSFGVMLAEPSLYIRALGAQAHVIHDTKELVSPGLYTDGIRFGVHIDAESLKEVMNVGEYFGFGMLLLPTNRLGGSDADRYAGSSLMSLEFTGEDSFITGPENVSSITDKATRPAAVFSTGGVTQPDGVFGENMIEWTLEMENAADTRALVALLRAAGVTVFDLSRGGTGLCYSVYIMGLVEGEWDEAVGEFVVTTPETDRRAREVAYRGFFIKGSLDNGVWSGLNVSYTLQRSNCATRIFDHYNFEFFEKRNREVTDSELLNGWSYYTPAIEGQS